MTEQWQKTMQTASHVHFSKQCFLYEFDPSFLEIHCCQTENFQRKGLKIKNKNKNFYEYA